MNGNQYTPDQVERIWQYRNSVITFFNDFVNSFLVAESVLLAVVGVIASSNSSISKIRFPIIILGFVLTLIWIYVQAKQRFIIQSLKKICIENIVEYREHQELRKKSIYRISISWILTFILPLLFAVIWVFIFYAVL